LTNPTHSNDASRSRSATVAIAAAALVCAGTTIATFLMLLLLGKLTGEALLGLAVG
jgi:hypothetical protein